jgi:preprotein translocase subunit YajC
MGSGGLLLVVLAFVFLYFVLVRPQKRRQVQQARLLDNLEVGDEVVTAGGIYGHITNIEGDDLMLEIAPGLEVRVARRAIGGVIKPETPEETDDDEPEHTEEADEHEAVQHPVAEDGG